MMRIVLGADLSYRVQDRAAPGAGRVPVLEVTQADTASDLRSCLITARLHSERQHGEAQIAEHLRRPQVDRPRLLGAQAELWPDWPQFAFITNRTDEIAIVEAEHRDHAVVE